MNRLKTKIFVFLIISILIFIISFKQIKFTYNYVAGTYNFFIKKDYFKANNFFSNLFDNKRMYKAKSNPLFYSSYAYGIIKLYNKKRLINKDNQAKNILEKFPDNLYLNYMSLPYSKFTVYLKNLDELSFLCLKDNELINLSSEIILYYLNKGLLSTGWVKNLIYFLKWQNNQQLAKRLMEVYNKNNKNIFINILKNDQPKEISLDEVFYSFTLNKVREYQEDLYSVIGKLKNIKNIINTKLKKNREYLKLRAQQKKLKSTVKEMKQYYKIGYPKFKKAVREMNNLNAKILEIENKIKINLKEEYISKKNYFENEIENKEKILSIFENRLNKRNSSTKLIKIVDGYISPKTGSIGERDIKNILTGNKEVLLYENFNKEDWNKQFHWSSMANRHPFSRGSYYGDIDNKSFRIMGFFTKKEKGKANSRARIWSKKQFNAKRGIYLIEFYYKTVFNEEKPSIWICRGVAEKKLPHTSNNWFKVYCLLSFNNTIKVEGIKPLIRVWGTGIFKLDNIKVIKISNKPSENFREVLIIAGFNDKKAF